MYQTVTQQARLARCSARRLANTEVDARNGALHAMACRLIAGSSAILDANSMDVSAAREGGTAPSMVDRLTLSQHRIEMMAESLRQIAGLPDPLGETLSCDTRPNGLVIRRVRVPIGVIGIIYESRPNVTIDSAALCIKSGNAVILRGGTEAIQTNVALAELISCTLQYSGLPEESVQLIRSTDRSSALELMRADSYVDLLIPRGGEALKKSVLEHARVPVLTSLGGNCHIYVDASADLGMAEEIAFNAKVSRPSVCNAMETLLVHVDTAPELLPRLVNRLRNAGVEVRGCERCCATCPGAVPASELDWSTEYLDLILAIRVVDSLEQAIEHISNYGTGHSEAIITRNDQHANTFTSEVDAACVFVNASTRFTDGYEFGFGAEVAISTQKLHARGPIGLRELTTYKSIVTGNGQVRL